jgi:hypothetical protein
MNPIVIILAVVVIVLVVVLYYFFSATATTLVPTASLKTVAPAITPLVNPTYTSYSYGIWVNVNTWDSNVDKTIFSRQNNIRLYLDKNTPTLKCDIMMSNNQTQTMIITDNFPIQKWTHVIVSMDNQFMDIYLDGKLVKSQRFYTPSSGGTTVGIMPKQPLDNPVPVFLGNSDSTLAPFTPFDAYVANFTRWTTPMDPQTAWNTYMSGNGGNSITKLASSYNVNLSILKNNVQTATYSLY